MGDEVKAPLGNGNRLIYFLLSALLGVAAFTATMTFRNAIALAAINANRFNDEDASQLKDDIMDEVFDNTREIGANKAAIASLPPDDFENRVVGLEMEAARRWQYKSPMEKP